MKVDDESGKNICGAKTRSGSPCRRAPLKGKKRCRLHGGTNEGAPKGNTRALKHGLYSEALLPGEEDLWARMSDVVGQLDHEITLSRVRLNRLLKLQREADQATLTGENQERALQLEEISSETSTEFGKSSRVVKRRRDYHAEIRQLTRLIGELEERRSKLISGTPQDPTDAAEQIRQALADIDAVEGYGAGVDDGEGA